MSLEFIIPPVSEAEKNTAKVCNAAVKKLDTTYDATYKWVAETLRSHHVTIEDGKVDSARNTDLLATMGLEVTQEPGKSPMLSLGDITKVYMESYMGASQPMAMFNDGSAINIRKQCKLDEKVKAR